MGAIRLNMDAVLEQGRDIASAKRTVMEVKSSIDSLYNQIDPKILARNNIASRMKNTSGQLAGIQNKMGQIQNTIEMGVNSYFSTEMEASQKAREIASGQ